MLWPWTKRIALEDIRGKVTITKGGKPLSFKKRSYAGADHNRLVEDWLTSSLNANGETKQALQTLRDRSSDLCRNHDIAKGAKRAYINNIIGRGIQLQAQIERGGKYDQALNDEVEKKFYRWAKGKNAHVRGLLSFAGLQRNAMGAVFERGECFIRKYRGFQNASGVPLQYEILEADLCDVNHHEDLAGGNRIRQGIEINAFGRPVAYWFMKDQPGDPYRPVFERVRVPAKDVIHLYIADEERPGQLRGVPALAVTMMRLRHLGGYEEAELIAARTAAAKMGFIESEDGDTGGEDVNGHTFTDADPGSISVLNPGESFKSWDPQHPNSAFSDFHAAMLHSFAAGIGLSFETISRDYSRTSFSSARIARQEPEYYYTVIQEYFSEVLCQDLWAEWLSLAHTAGVIKVPGYWADVMTMEEAVKWQPRGYEYLDPLKDIESDKAAIRAGFATHSDILRKRTGADYHEFLRQRKSEIDEAAKSGLVFDTSPALYAVDLLGTDDDGEKKPARHLRDLSPRRVSQ